MYPGNMGSCDTLTSRNTKIASRHTAVASVAMTSGVSQPLILPVVRPYTSRMRLETETNVPKISRRTGSVDHLFSLSDSEWVGLGRF